MRKPYETLCDMCHQTLTDCECYDGPSLPDEVATPTCPVCGSDPRSDAFREALMAISKAGKKSIMRDIANDALRRP